jgi:hypothetical protein
VLAPSDPGNAMSLHELRRRLRVAFQLPEPVREVPPELSELVDRLCAEVHRRQMSVAAVLALESSVPLQYAAGQLCAFFAPVLAGLGWEARANELGAFLDRPGAIEVLCRRLEETALTGPPAEHRTSDSV